MSSSNKIVLYSDFGAGVRVHLWGLELHTLPPPLHTITCICELAIGLEGQQFTKLGRKYQQDKLCFQFVNSDKHLPQSPVTGNFFRWRHF